MPDGASSTAPSEASCTDPAAQVLQDGRAARLVEVEGLSVHYLGYEEWVLDSVALTHLRGRVTAVIGPSGCGKTTLVRTMCGLVPHCLPSEYSGSLRLAGTEVADATVSFLATHVAYVGQNPDASVVTRTVHDDVAFPLQNLCLPRSEITARVEESLRTVGLLGRVWDDPWHLSGGQRQRLAVAVALAMRPQLLVLDEPTSVIDTTGRDEFYRLVSAMAEEGTGVIVIDHDLDPVLPVVDQVLALDARGRTIALGTPREVFTGHREELEDVGVWMPRALRRVPRPTGAEPPLTCAEAGITLPVLADLCSPDGVRYLERGEDGWHETAAIDTVAPTSLPVGTGADGGASGGASAPDGGAPDGGAPDGGTGGGTGEGTGAPGRDGARVELVDMEVPGRSPAVSMRLGGGELVALVGPNGAGKSSLLSALAGLVPLTATRARVHGRQVRRGRHLVGYVFQNPEHQFVATTVRKELEVGGTPAERVDQLLEQFHLTSHADQHPLTLSGGQARRLSVATMVSEDRDVIVLDEPTYGQDRANTVELMGFIEQLRAQGRTVIMATHDLELAQEHCTHVVALPQPAGTGRAGDPVRPADRDPGAPAAGAVAVPPRPQPRRGLLTGLNPLTLFVAVVPVIVMLFALKDHRVNLAVLVTASVLMTAARASRTRTLVSVLGSWAVTGLMLWIFGNGLRSGPETQVYDMGSAVAAGTGIGAMVSLVLLSGISTDAEALIRTLTTTFRMPYRIGSAGTAATAFIARFHGDLTVLRTARALRGVGRAWGPAAPVVRWTGSILPLMILAIQHAERVALSMDSRAFGAHRGRTELRDEPWRRRDWAVVACTWLVTAITWRTVG